MAAIMDPIKQTLQHLSKCCQPGDANTARSIHVELQKSLATETFVKPVPSPVYANAAWSRRFPV